MAQWAGIIMAAGEGRRMQSRYPKPLHPVCGQELIRYPVALLQGLGVQPLLVVVSPANAAAISGLLGDGVDYVVQPAAAGTGDAAARAVAALDQKAERLLVMGGDSPLLRAASLQQLMARHLARDNAMTLLTAEGMFATDLGRVVRKDDGQVIDLVEAAEENREDYSPAEVNGGVYCFNRDWLAAALDSLETRPNGEKYLTDLVRIGAGRGDRIDGMPSPEPEEIFGVNDRIQLAQVEAIRRWQLCEQWMKAGVTIQDPASVFIDAAVAISRDTVIRPNTMLLGQTRIGADCEIGPNAVIRDSQIADGCRVTASMLEQAVMGAGADVGPFSHLRPGTRVESGVHLGNFVEVKESRIGAGTLAGHFCYLGDADIGAGVNIGAGTITCNFDGQDKHPTTIGPGAFIGCDTMLVAPVTIGAGAATGAGTVVTKDVPEALLAVGVPARIRERKPQTDRKT